MAYPTVTFDDGAGNSVTLPAPSPGSSLPRVRARVIGRTSSGAVYVYDKGVSRYEARLAFSGLTQTERDNLAAFFDAVSGTFTYTDSAANTYTARILDGRLDFRQSAIQGAYDVTLTLEISSAGV